MKTMRLMKATSAYLFICFFFCFYQAEGFDDEIDLIDAIDNIIEQVHNLGKQFDNQTKKSTNKRDEELTIDLIPQDENNGNEKKHKGSAQIDEEECKRMKAQGLPCKNHGDDLLIATETKSDKRGIEANIRRWDNKIVRYAFSTGAGFSQGDKSKIRAFIDQFNKDFDCGESRGWIEVDDESPKYHVRIIRDGRSCYSYLGNISHTTQGENGYQDLSLGEGCIDMAVVHHEMLHAMGFAHEQSRPDRDNYVKINFDNIESGFEGNFRKIDTLHSELDTTAYDYYSVMHYFNNIFAKDSNKDTIYAIKNNVKDIGLTNIIGRQNKMSDTDIKELRQFYKCDETTTTTTSAPTTTKTTTTVVQITTVETTPTTTEESTTTTTEKPTAVPQYGFIDCNMFPSQCKVIKGMPLIDENGFSLKTMACDGNNPCELIVEVNPSSSSKKYCLYFTELLESPDYGVTVLDMRLPEYFYTYEWTLLNNANEINAHFCFNINVKTLKWQVRIAAATSPVKITNISVNPPGLGRK